MYIVDIVFIDLCYIIATVVIERQTSKPNPSGWIIIFEGCTGHNVMKCIRPSQLYIIPRTLFLVYSNESMEYFA